MSSEVKKTPEEWLAIVGGKILDPDGWSIATAPAWSEQITREEFRRRYAMNTSYIGPNLN